jgi:FixJ family two-component response regulator
VLPPAERRILELIGDGLSNREIGERLQITEKTVKNHVSTNMKWYTVVTPNCGRARSKGSTRASAWGLRPALTGPSRR